MTVPAAPGIQKHTGDGVLTAFGFSFKIYQTTDVEVYVEGVLKTLGVDYTIVFDTDAGTGTVTFTVPPPLSVTENILFRRVLAYIQSSQLPLRGKFPSALVERMIDRLTILAQQLKEITDRTLQRDPTDLNTDPLYAPLPDDGHALVWDSGVLANSTYDLETLLTDSSANAAAAAASAAAAAIDASTADTAATNAAADAVAADASATLAAGYAAGLNLPSVVGKALNFLRVKNDETGYEHLTPANVLAAINALSAAILTTKGDILVFNGTTTVRLGAVDNQVIMGDSTQASGLKYFAPIFTKEFVSSNQTPATNATRTLAHGLGTRPKFITLEYECTSADNGYSVGDVIMNPYDAGNAKGVFCYADATNVYAQMSSDTLVLGFVTKTTARGAVALANGSWVFRVRAFA